MLRLGAGRPLSSTVDYAGTRAISGRSSAWAGLQCPPGGMGRRMGMSGSMDGPGRVIRMSGFCPSDMAQRLKSAAGRWRRPSGWAVGVCRPLGEGDVGRRLVLVLCPRTCLLGQCVYNGR